MKQTRPRSGKSKVRFGIVGLGYIGHRHIDTITKAASREFCIGAVADEFGDRAQQVGTELGVPWFTDVGEMFDSGLIDAVILGVPHFWHPPLA
ncbi:MAG: Gfo/Idh/MocA family oxidoreductase, partial [Planctomycetes bacterium]|nr:Gfo/Idh/MocA family oxidoreductase [Planctomycetota bacterium]